MMRLLLLLAVVCVLTAAQRGGSTAAAQETRATVLSSLRRTRGDLPSEDLCFSLREDEEQRQLLCSDRWSKFNYNPFGLRFGKRYDYLYRRAIKSSRTQKLSPLFLSSRKLEVPT
ncbi:kisspeptin 2 isoform X2 [Melanotaenia boesemani]|uniref:kisspeptin 2 isoform X2 n=1 Tax=Melanotaenia boesemani TaxID=1250792 RepID=UPI001C04A54E|nr:kisspeptin 2 isoform X2 [Melanotaenia boesemani]